MPSNFSCIGLPLGSQEEFAELIDKVAPIAEAIPVKGGAYLKASDSSGAELWMQLNSRNEIIGANPHFSGPARMTAGITNSVDRSDTSPLDGAWHAWANPPKDEFESGDYPFVFDLPDFQLTSHLKLPYRAELQIAAFAQEAKCYESDEAYVSSQGDELKMASESFIPAGMFAAEGEPQSANAIMTGTVLSAEEKLNSWKGGKFFHCRIRSLGGEFDVVLDAAETPDMPKVGGIISGSFWLSAKIMNIPPKKGLLASLLGR